ncbi:hypothetical protein WME95_44490 [Sorangium sp. So ce327]|uniref:hypothetical protein n=1 Tax=Sorangium sp. So ce327 TaxID=3133301 RepID=UPI003F6415E8
MKFSIRFFDLVLVEIGLGCNDDGTYSIQKIFPVFLGRPLRPHLSLFFGDSILKPHFTAAKGRRDQFRRWLPSVSADALAKTCENLAGEAVRDGVARVEAVDFRALEEAGWTIHWADQRVLRRWVRQTCRRSSELRYDGDTVATLVMHVFRHAALPTDLESFAPESCSSVFAIRFNETHEPEFRVLSYYPRGIGYPDAAGKPFVAHPPGWYTGPFDAFEEAQVQRVVPIVALKKAVIQIEHWLLRYPRRAPLPELDELPKYAGVIFGFYAVDLLDYALIELAARVPASA